MLVRLRNISGPSSYFPPFEGSPAQVLAVLGEARQLIRSRTRAPSYWAAADRLSRVWLGEPLCSTSDFHVAAAPDLGGIIDWLYDELLSDPETAAESLPALTVRLQEMVDLEAASEALRCFASRRPDAGVDLVEATRVLIAALTTHGYAVLWARGSAELASRWLEAWGRALWKQNVQQQRVCGLGLLGRLAPGAREACMASLGLTAEDLVPRSTSFSEGVAEFLETFGETSASTVAILGSLPFSELPVAVVEQLVRLCGGESGPLPAMSHLFRLAPDVSFDPAESMNTGLFATAAARRQSVLEVAAEGPLFKPELDAALEREWRLQAARTRQFLEGLAARHGAEVGLVVAEWIPPLFRVLERLVPGTWKH